MFKKSFNIGIICLGFCSGQGLFAQNTQSAPNTEAVKKETFLEKVPKESLNIHEFLLSKDFESALKNFNKIKENSKNKDEKELSLIEAILLFRSGKLNESLMVLEKVEPMSANFAEYVPFYLASIFFEKGELAKARGEIEKVFRYRPNYKLNIESLILAARIEMAEKNWKKSVFILTKLEKRIRNDERWPEVLSQLLLSLNHLGQGKKSCAIAEKLYARTPAYDGIKSWGPFLNKNSIENFKLTCSFKMNLFQERVRNLQLSGLGERAKAEILEVKEAFKNSVQESQNINSIHARHLTQEGDIPQALEMLLKDYKNLNNDTEYLNQLAATAARAGEWALAIGLYDRLAKSGGRSSMALRAHFQAAFLSYQNNDYDGALRRFEAFIKRFPKSKQSYESYWFIAWMSYLKKDYDVAAKKLNAILELKSNKKRRVRLLQEDKINYWLAMSWLKLSRYKEAENVFLELVKEPGYYAELAAQRLVLIGEIRKKSEKSLFERFGTTPGFVGDKFLGRNFFGDSWLLPGESSWALSLSADTEGEESAGLADRTETAAEDASQEAEEQEVAEGLEEGAEKVNAEEEISSVVADALGVPDAGLIPMDVTPQFSISLQARMQKADWFTRMGIWDWARWELYEIEKRTSNKDNLLFLIKEYELIGSYNRSAYLAQVAFAKERRENYSLMQKNKENLRLWQAAFPQAYKEEVSRYAKNYALDQDLFWSIMRAETFYKKEAVSPVGAIGLMQVMPFTGQMLANGMGKKNFSAQDLFEPKTAIEIGGRYLQRLAKKFAGEVPLVAAAYNAGPHRVKQWLWRFGHLDYDEFVEHIPFVETRNYVKKVSLYFNTYKRIYGQNAEASKSGAVANTLNLTKPIGIDQSEPPPLKEAWDDI